MDELNALTHGNCVRENGESYTKFAERLMSFYKLEAEKSKAAEEECETASSAHASQVESCASLESKWTAQKQQCDAAQDIMDAAACAILDASQKVCKDYAKCNVQATTSYQVDLASVKSQEHGLKQEWKSLLLMQCQLKVFTTGSAGKQAALSTCVTADYTAAADSTIKLQYPNPVLRQAKRCTNAEGAAGRVAYEELHYQSLPGNAPAKTCTAECCAKCIEVTCPAGFQHKANAHALPGKLQEECCEKPFDGSTLLNTEAKKALLLGWLNNTLNWHLCFRKSTMSDGPRPQEFHKFCDDKGPTVFIAQLTTGKVIGGYTPLSWKGTERFEEDPSRSSFLFSLTNQFKHSLIENPPGDKRGSPGWKYAIRPSVHYCPIMGWSYDFKWSHYEGTIHNRVKLGWSYQCRIGGKNMQNCQNDFAGSAEKWGVTEWEMYYHSRAMKIETG